MEIPSLESKVKAKRVDDITSKGSVVRETMSQDSALGMGDEKDLTKRRSEVERTWRE